MVELFLSLKEKMLDETDGLGNTALHYAAMNGHIDVAVVLLRRGADIKVKNNQRETP